MERFADPYGDDRLPEGMTCTGYDADTGRKYYVDRSTGGSYVGASYAEYGVLTPLSAATAKQDNARHGRRLFDEGPDPVPKRRAARANTAPVPPTWTSTDCPRIIPRRSQKKEEEVHPKYQDGSDGPSKVLDRSKTRRAKTIGTWPPIGWEPYISATAANHDPSEDEEKSDAANSGTSEGGHKHGSTPRLSEYAFDQESLTFIPPAATASESPTDYVPIRQSSPVPFLDADLNPPRRQTEDIVGKPVVIPVGEAGSGGKKRRRTILHRLFRVKN